MAKCFSINEHNLDLLRARNNGKVAALREDPGQGHLTGTCLMLFTYLLDATDQFEELRKILFRIPVCNEHNWLQRDATTYLGIYFLKSFASRSSGDLFKVDQCNVWQSMNLS